VYGENPTVAFAEDYGPCVPISTYGASNLACEGLIVAYCHMFELQHEMSARLLRDRLRPKWSGAAGFATKLFRVLFHANLFDSSLGRQVIATARKTSA
jgi:hypothetical protein